MNIKTNIWKELLQHNSAKHLKITTLIRWDRFLHAYRIELFSHIKAIFDDFLWTPNENINKYQKGFGLTTTAIFSLFFQGQTPPSLTSDAI